MLIDGCPTHFTFEGDYAEVSKWIAQGQRLVQWCISNNMPARDIYPSPEVRISATYLDGIAKLHIKAGGCPKFVSGLVDLIFPPKPIFDLPDITWDLKDSQGKPYKALYRLYSRTTQGESEQYGPWDYSRKLAGNYTEDNPTKANTVIFKTPGKYSGEMRKVVQILIGQGKPVPYDYHFDQCHGIFRARDGKPWVIEISRANGVLAWKLPVCNQAGKTKVVGATKDLMEQLGYWPLASKGPLNDISAAINKGTVLRLLTPEEVTPVFSKFGAFEACGWAFNSNGHEAQNTCFEFDAVQPKYLRGYRYRLVISELGNKPSQAFLTADEDGLVYGDRINGFKVPSEVLGSLINFDYYTNFVPPTGPHNGPLYVFYNESDTAIVARTQTGIAASSYVNTQLPFSSFPGWINPDYAGSRVNSSGIQFAYPVPVVDGYSSQILSFEGARDFFEIQVRDTWSGLIADSSFSGTGNLWGPNAVRTTGVGAFMTDYEELFFNSLVVPFYDRESIYIFSRRQEVINSGFTKDLGTTQWWRGQNLSRGVYDAALNIGAPCGGIDGPLSWRPQFAVQINSPPSTPGVVPDWTHCGGTFYAIYPGSTFANGDILCAVGWVDISTQTLPGANSVSATSVVNTDFISVLTASGITNLGAPLNGDDFVEFWDGQNLKFMEVVQDAFGQSWFASRDVNNTDWTMYDAEVGNYPITEFQSSIKQRFYVGKP